MRSARAYSQVLHSMKRILLLVLVLAPATSVFAPPPVPVIQPPFTANGTVGVAFTYQVTATNNPDSYNATPLPAGLSVNTTTGLISGTPTTAGLYSVTISATNQHGTGSATLVITIVAPNFVGFRLPDFLMSPGSPNNPRLMLQMGANGTSATANRFNATLEVDASGNGTAWVPYNRFVGINDTASWITDAPLQVRDSLVSAGTPRAFANAQLTQSPPAVYIKADPRSTRFGVFQMDTALTTANSRILLSPWPSNDANVANGFGGAVGTSFPGPVEHAPNRFPVGTVYYPATFSINGPVDARDTATTIYADNDSVTRPADAIYPNTTYTGRGSSTPYNTTVYRPIMLNRPFRNVAELGYAFRDLPWKTLDFFSDKSADAGLLDIFTINDGPAVLDGNGNFLSMGPIPSMVAGQVNPNTTQAADLQSVLAGTIRGELDSPLQTVSSSAAQTMATNIVSATSATPMQNKSELLTRANLPTQILPTASNDDQAVKARREVVARAVSSVAQSRVWNLVIDVVAEAGRYKPNATSLQNDFVVEGEQHYWVHVAIDRFTGEVLDKQIEVVNE